ncbi:MAG: DUF6716 putative glycosyltransferase [Cyanobacteria bacterium J06638_7]
MAQALRGVGAEVALITAPELVPSLSEGIWPLRAPQATLVLDPLAAAASELLGQVDAAGVFLASPRLQPFLHSQRQAARLRRHRSTPLFTGPLLPMTGDALSADLLPRLGYDLLCLPGDAQVEELSWLIRGTAHERQAHEAIGLWSLPTRPIGHGEVREPLLVVLEQERIPASARDTALLYSRLRSLALASPSWQVRLQPDHPLPADPREWSEISLAWHHQQDDRPPQNLQLGQLADLPFCLMQASACLGISSPWLLSAMVWGKPTVVLGEYGIRTEFNSPLFFASGVMRRLADCQPLEELLQAPAPNAHWLEGLGWGIADGPQRLLRRLQELAR